MISSRLVDLVPGQSFLENAFVRWVLAAAATPGIAGCVVAQRPVAVADRTYLLDYMLAGARLRVVVELDGFAFHSSKAAFVYDRIRQNDLTSLGFVVLRFSYDAIRDDTARCVAQLQAVLAGDSTLAAHLIANPIVPVPDDMTSNLLGLATPPASSIRPQPDYFDLVRQRMDLGPLRVCQREAMASLANYYRRGGINAACVMSVGAGKTALGVAAALAFTTRRALIVTPGRVIRGTFATALDPGMAGNALYTLRGGPLIAGCRPPRVMVLDSGDGPIRSVSRDAMLPAEIIVTNFHALSVGDGESDLLSKLGPDDVDFIVVDEAHIAAAESYQRLFGHFPHARRLLMSACFTRADGKTVAADVVYRYRLIDSIADGHAKHLRAHRFTPEVEQTTYEIIWPSGDREEIVGKQALLEVMQDERKLARITATSEEPIRRVMQIVRQCLNVQDSVLAPVRPRVLFAALGQRHAEQVARIAIDHGIPCATLHHSMSDASIAATRARLEAESGNLQGIVQLKMLGQGDDLPAITVVVPMRPYGSFGEFYQFLGRGIRIIHHPALIGRDDGQHLDVVYPSPLARNHRQRALPHRLMAETCGPAVNFWEGVALTAWYICEGPHSRTSLEGLRDYHQRHLRALEKAGTRIHPNLFEELVNAEQYLGPPQDVESDSPETDVTEVEGIRISVRISSSYQRRDGFEILLDIVTRHRQGWTRRYLAEYLRFRWNAELTAVARELHRLIAVRGKPPTFRQFAKLATGAANHWFNGDLAKLYTAIGEKAPAMTRRVDLLPTSADEFVNTVYVALGGQYYNDELYTSDPEAVDRYNETARLAARSIYYLQIAEATGRRPEPAEFSVKNYGWKWAGGLDRGWPLLEQAIDHAIGGFPT